MRPAVTMPLVLLLASCTGAQGSDARQTEAFSAIAPDGTIEFTGTEPFWGGEVADGRLRYATPENIDGATIPVARFAGNSGVSFSGMLDQEAFDLTITMGECSDQMSDRSYPFTATLKLGRDEVRSGCAWTARQPYRELRPR